MRYDPINRPMEHLGAVEWSQPSPFDLGASGAPDGLIDVLGSTPWSKTQRLLRCRVNNSKTMIIRIAVQRAVEEIGIGQLPSPFEEAVAVDRDGGHEEKLLAGVAITGAGPWIACTGAADVVRCCKHVSVRGRCQPVSLAFLP
jgi:hypothetical protein